MNEPIELSEEQQNKLEAARRRVIETVGKNMELYGVTLSVGYLYGEMFFKDHAVTLDEMGKIMGMSKTSMSTGMRTLMDLKMVNKVWEKGTRKDLYEVEWDWYQTFVDFFNVKWRKLAETNMHAVKRSIREVEAILAAEETPEEAIPHLQKDLLKMKEAVQYYRWLGKLIDTFEDGSIFEMIPKDEP
ncbi:GbsR/MarR family transcriptional regulator [Marinicrinis sediminis]|uniref:HTH-type transcriptional regulator n=1 Tax=Marinicrinis sediminis TaxID=1652465 RepID=A0ABW5R7Z9_9BACL